MTAVPFTTARLRLRPLRPDDLEALAEVYLHPQVQRWIGSHTRADVERELALQGEHEASLGWSLWAVEHRESGRLIGDCGLQPLEHRGPEVELGYDLHPDRWGQGLATEASRAVLERAFGPLGLNRVIAVVKPDHGASQRVLEKAGLRPAGTREAYGEPMLVYAADRATYASPPRPEKRTRPSFLDTAARIAAGAQGARRSMRQPGSAVRVYRTRS